VVARSARYGCFVNGQMIHMSTQAQRRNYQIAKRSRSNVSGDFRFDRFGKGSRFRIANRRKLNSQPQRGVQQSAVPNVNSFINSRQNISILRLPDERHRISLFF
jgi:hypothetical protein